MLLEKWAMNNHLEIAVKEMVLLSKAVYHALTNKIQRKMAKFCTAIKPEQVLA